MTNGWIKTVFLLFSCVSGRLWLSLFRGRWGQTGLWPTLSDPIMSSARMVSVCTPSIPMTSSACCRVRKMSQWCGTLGDNHAEFYTWMQARAGVCLFLDLVHFFFSVPLLCSSHFLPSVPLLSLFFFNHSLFLLQTLDNLLLMTPFFYKLFAWFRPGCVSL